MTGFDKMLGTKYAMHCGQPFYYIENKHEIDEFTKECS
jgi:hypothetical protein